MKMSPPISNKRKTSKIRKWIKKQTEARTSRKHQIIQDSLEGKLTVSEASRLLGLSERQIKRLRKGVAEQGKDAVIHGSTGKIPSTTISQEQRQHIIDTYKTKYSGANYQHFTELLAEHESITVSVTTVKRILKNGGVQSPRHKRKPKKHIRRKRHAREGSMAQTDATPYDFFGMGEMECLHGIIDDATGKILGLHMTKHECLEGYFAVFEQMIENHGIPASIYADRHTIFSSPKSDKLTVEEELAGVQVNDTQLGRALRELGIVLIKARSPQAKGRIERLWNTLQDRLTIEFRINGIINRDVANAFLPSFIERYNARFQVDAAEVDTMFVSNTYDLVSILCVRETRKLDTGGAFSFYNQFFVVLGDIPRRAIIEVIVHRKYGIYALYKGRRYAVNLIEKPKRSNRKQNTKACERTPYIPPDSHYHKRGKETYVHYSGEYSDKEILTIVNEIFTKSFK